MVVRTFDIDEMVHLPRVSATDAIALCTALETRALAAGALPPAIARSFEAVRQSLAVLRGHAEARVPGPAPGDSKELANRNLDAAWGSLRWWSRGWALLPYGEHATQAEAARMLEAQIFPDGLRFTQLPFRSQWVESQARLGLIDKQGLATVIATLGGETILSVVRRAHADFGRSLGLTEVTDEPDTSPQMREGTASLISAIRRYVLQVTAHADSGEPGSEALADALLLPLKTWKTRPTAPAAGNGAPETEPGDNVQAPPAE
jgi:hypothetical protein